MDLITYLIPILALTLLSAGWVAVQLLAQKMQTKNHIDNASSCGNGCTCMGSEREGCDRKEEKINQGLNTKIR